MPALGEVVVSAHGVEKYFGSHHVLRGVDLEAAVAQLVSTSSFEAARMPIVMR